MQVMLQVLAVQGIGEVTPGADLADLIAGAAPWLCDGDVLVVTSKIVSKAEGRLVDLPPPGPDRDRRRAEILAAETARLVAARGGTRIVATQHGFVMANAGIDSSNVSPDQVVLLPKDPDASARALRDALAARAGVRVAVVVSDTMGRPWRNGLTDVALGAAGIEPLRDHRGETDPYGNQLHLTQLAVVDELAAAAELVKGKHDQVPVAVVRGLGVGLHDDAPGVVATLVRDPAQDMFRLGTAEAYAAGLRAAAAGCPPPGPDPADGVLAAARRALALVGPAAGHRVQLLSLELPQLHTMTIRCLATEPPDPTDPATVLVSLGMTVQRLRAALAAEGLATGWRQVAPGQIEVHLLAPPHPAGESPGAEGRAAR